jgi:hypothetical protein
MTIMTGGMAYVAVVVDDISAHCIGSSFGGETGGNSDSIFVLVFVDGQFFVVFADGQFFVLVDRLKINVSPIIRI